MMTTTEFRVDDTLINMGDDQEIDVQILDERHGRDGVTFQSLLARKQTPTGPVYANVSWDGAAGQMTAGKWFHRGRSASSVDYVAQWRETI